MNQHWLPSDVIGLSKVMPPQGSSRGRVEQNGRLVQEVRRVELIAGRGVPKPFSTRQRLAENRHFLQNRAT